MLRLVAIFSQSKCLYAKIVALNRTRHPVRNGAPFWKRTNALRQSVATRSFVRRNARSLPSHSGCASNFAGELCTLRHSGAAFFYIRSYIVCAVAKRGKLRVLCKYLQSSHSLEKNLASGFCRAIFWERAARKPRKLAVA